MRNQARLRSRVGSQCLINALTGHVGSSTHLSDNPTNQELIALLGLAGVFGIMPPIWKLSVYSSEEVA